MIAKPSANPQASLFSERSRGCRLGMLVLAVTGLLATLWAVAIAFGSQVIALLASLLTGGGILLVYWVTRKVLRWRAGIWLGSYLRTSRVPLDKHQPLDICFMFVDHFEPDWRGADRELQLQRVRHWEEAYRQAIDGHYDSDGRCPQHTWFCPVAIMDPSAMDHVAQWPGRGWGEIEYHLHHGPAATEEQIRNGIKADIQVLTQLGATSNGRYGFVHGMYALAGGDPRHCNAPNEIDVLLETGCYADFTFPAIGSPAQPSLVNRIYYAKSTGRPRPHATGAEAAVGQAHEGLLIIPGPMSMGLDRRLFDDAGVGPDCPPHPKRITRWLDAHVHVLGRPNLIFISVHSHTANDHARDFLFAGPMQRLWAALEQRFRGPNRRLHYVTAREAYNIVKSVEAGHDGDPNHFRDFAICPPPGAASPPDSLLVTSETRT